MSELKHTPGPCHVEDGPMDDYFNQEITHTFSGCILGLAKEESDALLYATASEMLNRLLSVYISSNKDDVLLRYALKKTIEKATGLKIEELL